MSIYDTLILIWAFETMARAGKGASGRDRYSVSKTNVFETLYSTFKSQSEHHRDMFSQRPGRSSTATD